MKVKIRFVNTDGASLKEAEERDLELNKYPRYHIAETVPEGTHAVIVVVDGTEE